MMCNTSVRSFVRTPKFGNWLSAAHTHIHTVTHLILTKKHRRWINRSICLHFHCFFFLSRRSFLALPKETTSALPRSVCLFMVCLMSGSSFIMIRPMRTSVEVCSPSPISIDFGLFSGFSIKSVLAKTSASGMHACVAFPIVHLFIPL